MIYHSEEWHQIIATKTPPVETLRQHLLHHVMPALITGVIISAPLVDYIGNLLIIIFDRLNQMNER